MEVKCSQCKVRFTIPDNKIPEGRAVRIGCPKCGHKIKIEAHETSPNTTSPAPSGLDKENQHIDTMESKQGHEGEKELLSEEYADADDEALLFYSGDAKLALLLTDNDMEQKIKQPIEELGFKTILSADTRGALEKLRFHHFDLILLTDDFDGQELGNNPIMNYLNHMSMSSRRRIFLTLLSNHLHTMDSMTAYAMSANMVINLKDIANLSAILKKGLIDHEKFYKIFMDTLLEVGKS
jgi:predicted Zn finger-like uncharacterized protein